MKDIELALFTGVDIPIPECELTIHQPTIKEISMIGEKPFLSGVQILTVDKKVFKDGKGLSNTTNFQIFMTIMNNKESKEGKKMALDALMLITPNAKITVTPRSLLFNCDGKTIIIDENNFGYFQDILRQVFCIKYTEDDFNPINAEAAKIAERMKQTRHKVAQLKGEDVGSVYARYISSLSIGLKMPIENLIQCTIYQIRDMLERFSLWSNWDIDIRSRLAGADAKSKPED